MSDIITPNELPVQGTETPVSGLTRDSISSLVRPAIETAFLDMAPAEFDTTSTFDDLHIVAAFRGSLLRLLDIGQTLEHIDQQVKRLEIISINDHIKFFANAFGVSENNGVFTVLASPDPLTTARIKGSTKDVNRIMGARVSHQAKNLPLAKFTTEYEANVYFAQIAKLYNNSMTPEGIPLAVFGGVERKI